MGQKLFRSIGSTNYGSNLTELNATDAVNTGFMDHADWMAHVMRYAVVMKHMKRDRSVQTVLDVGCGKFPLLTYMWRNRVPLGNVKYTGIDLRAKREWLEMPLPEAPDIELIQMNIVRDDPSSIGKHDVVVCTEMLEHIDKVEAPVLMSRLRSWVKDDGLLFLSSPNLGGSDTVAENHTDENGNPREWTYEGKVALLKMAGFEVISAIGTFIRLDNIPQGFWNDYTTDIKQKLPNAFFRVFAAAAFPAQSNNAMLICKPK